MTKYKSLLLAILLIVFAGCEKEKEGKIEFDPEAVTQEVESLEMFSATIYGKLVLPDIRKEDFTFGFEYSVRKSVDSVLSVRLKPYIVIMGDLNGGPDSPSVRDGLGAIHRGRGKESADADLVTMMDGIGQGSYQYQGEWDCYDHFVVSGSLLNGLGCTSAADVKVLSADFMLQDDGKYGGRKPYRTYNGYRYQEGYSDHLPVILFLKY